MAAQSELQPRTPAGARLFATAESLAAQFASQADANDRTGRYSLDNCRALKDARYFVAPIPEPFGGLGVESVYDILVASTRLARGDPATTLGLNMHLLFVMNMVRRWRMACHRNDQRRMAAFAESLEQIVSENQVVAIAVSEPGQNLTMPATRAARTDTGWTLNGHKIFCTMSPAATMLSVAVTYASTDGTLLYGYAQVPRDTPGVVVHEDWDALGMRASGSNSVTLQDVKLPATALRGGFPAGQLTAGYMERNLTAGLFHASASLGIAEAAHENGVARHAAKQPASMSSRTLTLAAENAIDVSAIRAVFGRAAEMIDSYYHCCADSDGSFEELTPLFAEVQAAKTFVNQAAARVVDRALTLSGGAGYMSKHPLSRAYRDVRAGAFMQPLSDTRAYDFIGQIALQLEPMLS